MLDKNEIGKRIADLRKQKDYSQEELAKMIGISRSSLAQIENGKRQTNIIELMAISKSLEFSLDEIVSKTFSLKVSDEVETKAKPISKTEERISIPKLQVEKFINVLLYVLEKCAGKPNVGETVLYKLLYFSDFNYYELYEEHLTGALYKKLAYGPVPQKLDTIVAQMIDQGMVQRVKAEYHGYPQTRYLPLAKADLTTLRASEKEVIDKVIEQYSDWSASSISAYSHKDMPWMASNDGEVIDYELVFYRDAPFSVRNYGEDIEEK